MAEAGGTVPDAASVTIDDVRRAAERIAPYAHRTPVITCQAVDAAVGAQIYFKCENLQKVGAFKFRGACNAVFALSGAAARAGVITHSSGNHAAALALAARARGIEAVIVMPDTAPAVKRAAVEGYGARVVTSAADPAAREAAVERLQAQHRRTLVHPYDDPQVIAGQGTAALELVAEVPGLDAIYAPVGGGGLLAGTAIVARAAGVAATYGAEPAAADDAMRSLRAGHIIPAGNPDTIADGLRTSLGGRNFAIIRRDVADIATSSEARIASAMRFMWERTKLLVEPSAALPLAVLLEHGPPPGLARIGVIVSGGNADLDHLPWP